ERKSYATLCLSSNVVRVDGDADVNRTDHLFDFDILAAHADLNHLRHRGTEGLHQSQTARPPGRRRRAPASLLRSQLENASKTRRSTEQFQTEFQRILAGGCRHFINEGFHGKTRVS